MVLNRGIPVLRKFLLKNLLKIPFGEGQVQDPIPALPGHGSKIPVVLLSSKLDDTTKEKTLTKSLLQNSDFSHKIGEIAIFVINFAIFVVILMQRLLSFSIENKTTIMRVENRQRFSEKFTTVFFQRYFFRCI
jgi:hypothetical protein